MELTGDIPIIYAYLYYKLKKSTRTDYIRVADIKAISARIIIKKGGFPRFLIKYIVEDLIKLKLLERENMRNYKLLPSDCDKKLKQLMFFC